MNQSAQQNKKVRATAMLLKQASDPTRLEILQMLSEEESHVGAMCEKLRMSQPAVSHHLSLLRHGGLIAPRRQGKNNFYALTDAGRELTRVVRGMLG